MASSPPAASVTSATSCAMAVPVPMAMPTSAAESAGASLTPSPTMTTRLSAGHERLHVGMLVLGEQVSAVLGDARLGGDACGGALVIAGEHDDVVDALRAKRRNCLGHSCL